MEAMEEEVNVIETVEAEVEVGAEPREIVLANFESVGAENVLSSQNGTESKVIGYLEVQPSDSENAALFAHGIEIGQGQHLILTQEEGGNEIMVVVSDNQEMASEQTISHFSQSIASTDGNTNCVLMRSNHLPIHQSGDEGDGFDARLYPSGLSSNGLEYESSVIMPVGEISKARLEGSSKDDGVVWVKDDETEVLFFPSASVLSQNHEISTTLLSHDGENNANNQKLMELASIAQELQSEQTTYETCEDMQNVVDSPAAVEVIVQRQNHDTIPGIHTVIAETSRHQEVSLAKEYNVEEMEMYGEENSSSDNAQSDLVSNVVDYMDSNVIGSGKINSGVSVIQVASSAYPNSQLADVLNAAGSSRSANEFEVQLAEVMHDSAENIIRVQENLERDVRANVQLIGDSSIEDNKIPEKNSNIMEDTVGQPSSSEPDSVAFNLGSFHGRPRRLARKCAVTEREKAPESDLVVVDKVKINQVKTPRESYGDARDSSRPLRKRKIQTIATECEESKDSQTELLQSPKDVYMESNISTLKDTIGIVPEGGAEELPDSGIELSDQIISDERTYVSSRVAQSSTNMQGQDTYQQSRDTIESGQSLDNPAKVCASPNLHSLEEDQNKEAIPNATTKLRTKRSQRVAALSDKSLAEKEIHEVEDNTARKAVESKSETSVGDILNMNAKSRVESTSAGTPDASLSLLHAEEAIIVPPTKTYTRKPKKLDVSKLNTVKIADSGAASSSTEHSKDEHEISAVYSDEERNASEVHSGMDSLLDSVSTSAKRKKVSTVSHRMGPVADQEEDEVASKRNSNEFEEFGFPLKKRSRTPKTLWEPADEMRKSNKNKEVSARIKKGSSGTDVKVDSESKHVKFTNGTSDVNSEKRDYDPSNEYNFHDSSDDDSNHNTSFQRSFTGHVASKAPKVSSPKKTKGRPFGSQNRIKNSEEVWNKLLKSSPTKKKPGMNYLARLKKSAAKRALSCEGIPLPYMALGSPILDRANVPKRGTLLGPKKNVKSEDDSLNDDIGETFILITKIQPAEIDVIYNEPYIYSCFSCNAFETERIGNLIYHVKYCIVKDYAYDVGDMARRETIRGGQKAQSSSNSAPLSKSKTNKRKETLSSKDKTVDSDDDDAVPSTSDDNFGFTEDDVVWVQWQRIYWPALVRRMYHEEKRASVYFIDLPSSKNSSQKVTMRKLHNFNDAKMNKKFLCEGETSHGEAFVKAVQKGEEFLRKRRYLDMNITASEFFTDLHIGDQSVDDVGDEIADPEVDVVASTSTDPYPGNVSKSSNFNDDDDEDMPTEIERKDAHVVRLEMEEEEPAKDEYINEWIAPSDVVKVIKDGTTDDHVLGVYECRIDSERHSKYFGDDLKEKKSLMEDFWFGPIKDPHEQDEVYDYLSNLFNMQCKNVNLSTALTYIYQVWCPEAIMKAISEIKEVSMSDAKSLFMYWGRSGVSEESK